MWKRCKGTRGGMRVSGWIDGDCLGVTMLDVMFFGMNLFVFFQVLRAFEGFATDLGERRDIKIRTSGKKSLRGEVRDDEPTSQL